MELAQGDTVADHRLALGVAVGRDLGRVQELQVAQPAEGAALGVRAEHPLAEGDLMEPATERRGHIRPPQGHAAWNGRQLSANIDRLST
jgi:hypothetical protein